MSLATKCGVVDGESCSVEVHCFSDGVIQLHAIGDFDEADLSGRFWQICTLSPGNVESLIWSLQQALKEPA